MWMPVAQAATQVIEVRFLPLSEAKDVARSQLSAQGSVSALASRRMLIVDDDASHIRKVQALLAKLDQPMPQYQVSIDMLSERALGQKQASVDMHAELGSRIPGGWVRIRLEDRSVQQHVWRHYSLRVSGGESGRIEAGKVYVVAETRHWLDNLGIHQAATMLPVTGGFDIAIHPAGAGKARVSIHPWLREKKQASALRGQSEVLVDLGSASRPHTPPGNPARAPVRFYGLPQSGDSVQRIDIVNAVTELTVPLDQDIAIAAVDGDARSMSDALLAGRSHIGQQQLVIRLRIHRF